MLPLLQSRLAHADSPLAPAGLCPCAVLVPLIGTDESTSVLLIRRAQDLTAHGGEIAFPGGKQEPGDGSWSATALREAEEEVGIHRADAEVLGALKPTETAQSGFWIVPVVARLQNRRAEPLDTTEVAEVLIFPLAELAAPQRSWSETFSWAGRSLTVPFLEYRSEIVIWGATGRILIDLLIRLDLWPPNSGGG